MAVAAGGDGEGQTPSTFAAEDRAAQIVLAVLGTLASHPLFIEHRLNPIKGLLIDQRLMAAREGLFVGRTALVDDPTGVVGIAQDALQGGGADFAAKMPPRAAGAQAKPVQLTRELRNRVFAAGVELESGGQEVMAIRVGNYAGDFSAIGQLVNGVEITDTRPAVGAATLGLLEQAPLDALSGQHRLILVVGDNHALVEKAGSGVLTGHRLGNRNQASAGLMHQLAGLPMVHGVARPVGERPDDHVVHSGGRVLVALFQLVQHGEKAGALVQIDVSASAGIAELASNLGVKLGGLIGASLALSAD